MALLRLRSHCPWTTKLRVSPGLIDAFLSVTPGRLLITFFPLASPARLGRCISLRLLNALRAVKPNEPRRSCRLYDPNFDHGSFLRAASRRLKTRYASRLLQAARLNCPWNFQAVRGCRDFRNVVTETAVKNRSLFLVFHGRLRCFIQFTAGEFSSEGDGFLLVNVNWKVIEIRR